MRHARGLLLAPLAAIVPGLLLAWWLGGSDPAPVSLSSYDSDRPLGASEPRPSTPAAATAPALAPDPGLEGPPGGGAARPPSTDPLPAPPPASVVEPSDPSGPFRGVCVDDRGRPVAGATVAVTSGRTSEGRGVEPRAYERVRSGSDGSFRIEAAPPAVVSLRVRAAAPGRVAGRADEELVRAEVRRLVLLPAAEVRVRVVEKAGGGAVRGARVTLFAGDAVASADEIDLRVLAATSDESTDEGGRAVLLALGGACGVLVRAPSRAPQWVRPLFVPPAGRDLTVALERGAALRFRVADEGGWPVAGARVLASWRLGWRGEAASGADGLVALDGLPAAASEGGESAPLAVAVLSAGRPVHLFAPPSRDLDGRVIDLAIGPGGPAAGTVSWAGRAPAGARVVLSPALPVPDFLDLGAMPSAEVGASGEFRIEAVPVVPWAVRVRDRTWGTVPADARISLDAASAAQGRTGPVPPSFRYEVEVATDGGEGIAKFRLVDAAGRGVPGAGIDVGRGDGSVLHLLGRLTTDAEGRATATGLPAGDVVLVVFPPSGPAFSARTSAAGPGGEERVVPLPAGRASGRVRRLDGAGAPVRLLLGTRLGTGDAPMTEVGRHAFAADESGAFSVGGLGPDDYVLAAEPPLLLVRPPFPVRAGAEGLDLLAVTPAEEASLRPELLLTFADGGASRVEGVVQAFYLRPGGTETLFSAYLVPAAEPDLWISSAVPPGSYEVLVRVPGYGLSERRPLVVAGGAGPPRVTVPLSR